MRYLLSLDTISGLDASLHCMQRKSLFQVAYFFTQPPVTELPLYMCHYAKLCR